MKRLVILLGLILLTTGTFACECLPILTLEQHFKRADIVFYAKVTAINDKEVSGFRDTMHFIMDSLYSAKGGYHPRLKILEIIKGNFKSDLITNNTLNYQSKWTLCDVFFKRDSEYIVFGNFDENGNFETSICSSTTGVPDKELLRLLKGMR
jgi:hypothetical protein